MKLDLRMNGLERVRGALARLDGPKTRAAFAEALNDTAKQVRKVMVDELRTAFDRPTRWIYNSPKYVPATPEKLQAVIIPTLDTRNIWSQGGKVGVDPQDVLQAQEWGGGRRDKRSEVAMRRAGILPAGMQTVIPSEPYPGSDDGNGNLRGTFLQQLLSYMSAYSEQGYKANMSDRRKAALRNQQRLGYLGSRKTLKTTLGVRYFVSRGRARSGRASHLAPGIWAASGLHEVDLKPVLLFVRAGLYTPKISMDKISRKANADAYLERRLRYRIRLAAGE